MGDEHGKLRVLFLMRDFDGWAAGALWDNVKVGLPRFDQVERLAIVADRRWERGMGVFCGPFTEAEVRFFVIAEADEARQWVWEGLI
jgi:hypothetical protein